MSKEIRKRLNKMYNQIDKLAKKGKDNIFEYYKFIDSTIDKGEFSDFEQCLFYYYKIDIVDTKDMKVMKKNTWKEILFQTNTSFQTKLKKIYDTKGVYQMSFDVYALTQGTYSNVLLGQIKEVDVYTSDSQALIENREFAKLMNTRKTFLDVIIPGPTFSTTTSITTEDESLTNEQNLLNRYTIAVDLLLS